MTNRDQNESLFKTFIVELAKHFPDYNLVDNNMFPYFVDKNDVRKGFYVTPDYYKGTIMVSTRFYKDNKSHSPSEIYVNNQKLPSISCGFSYSRPADIIANGIKKRFLGAMDEYYQLMLQKWAGEDNYKINKLQSLVDICAAIGIKPQENYHQKGEYQYKFSTYGCDEKVRAYLGEIDISSGDNIQITTSYLSREKALKLIEAIKNL